MKVQAVQTRLVNKEQLIQYYRRFCRWQHALPQYVNRHEGESVRCHNCGTEYADNFCPRCGQRAEVGRVGWKSIKDNVALLWGLDNRSLVYTLLQLFGRPGYLVRDYISGHRQVSFPPIKMLVIVCLFVVILESIFHLENDVLPLKFKIKEIDMVIEWLNSQKSWAMLLVNSVYILPTWFVFRYAPGYPRHTLPEGFFLQVFLSVQDLLIGLISSWSGLLEGAISITYVYITYCQLFGYGWWSTLWRLVFVLLMQLFVVLMVIMAMLVNTYDKSERDDMIVGFLFLLPFMILAIIVMLVVTNRYNKRASRERQPA